MLFSSPSGSDRRLAVRGAPHKFIVQIGTTMQNPIRHDGGSSSRDSVSITSSHCLVSDAWLAYKLVNIIECSLFLV